MKKLFTTFLCLIALVCSSQAFAQSISKSITIYDGTAENQNVPFYFYYGDVAGTKSQVIYPAESLAELNGRKITGVKFYNAGYAKDWSGNLVVSFYEGDHKAVEEYTNEYFEALYIGATFKEVFNGEISLKASSDDSYLEFTFNEPYTYTGKNLVIDITNTTASSYQNVYFYGQEISYSGGVHGYNGSPNSYHSFLPKATFTYELSYDELPEYEAFVSTDKIDFSTIFTNNEVSQEINISNTGKNNITATITGVNAPFEIESTSFEIASTTSVVVPVKFAPTADGNYTGTITIDLGEAGSYEVALSGNAMSMPNGYIVNFDVANKTLPEGWTGWNIKETYDYSIYEYVFESAEAHADLFVGTEIAGTKAVTIKDNANPYKEYPSQFKVYMVSPLVSGNILFSARGTNTADYITPEVTAYKATFDNNNGYTIDETPININWQSPLTNAEWSYGIFTVEEPTQIAFFMNYGAISMFASDAEGEATGINNINADDTNCVLNGDDLAIYSNSNLVSYQVVSTSGAIVAQGKLADKAAQVKLNAPAGIYLVSVTSENGTSVYKLLKK